MVECVRIRLWLETETSVLVERYTVTAFLTQKEVPGVKLHRRLCGLQLQPPSCGRLRDAHIESQNIVVGKQENRRKSSALILSSYDCP